MVCTMAQAYACATTASRKSGRAVGVVVNMARPSLVIATIVLLGKLISAPAPRR